jgi:uncharacterized membrane protein
MLETKRCNVCGTLFCEPEDLPPGCPYCKRMKEFRRKELLDKWLVYLGVAVFIVLPGASYLYMQSRPSQVTYIFDFSDPATRIIWAVLLFCGLMCAGIGYVLTKEVWKWMRGKEVELKTGSNTLLLIIVEAILFVIAAWFFGSAGMRFISQ